VDFRTTIKLIFCVKDGTSLSNNTLSFSLIPKMKVD